MSELVGLLATVRTIAVVGASANPARRSHDVIGFLQGHGFRVTPVNPYVAFSRKWRGSFSAMRHTTC